ncbi:1-acyl-sn-glycerol-3-phosphate acyltransferase [bacterium]|nr:MAG: 1-acyl-sn-glycerol-3-phosphate acyltransferase [bacterium]
MDTDKSVVLEDSYKIDFPGFFRRNKITGTINFISWIMMAGSAFLACLIFFILNRTTIKGRNNIPKQTKNVLFASNHTSYAFDSYFIGIIACVPRAFFKGFSLPYHPTSYQHYYANKFMTFVCSHMRCIPVKRKWKNEGGLGEQAGKFDEEGVNLTLEALKQGTVIYFPEGTRTKDGSIGEGKAGSGMLPYETRATVVPVRIENVNKLPAIGLKLKVTYGKPIYLDDLYDLPKSKETSKLIADRIMDEIRSL